LLDLDAQRRLGDVYLIACLPEIQGFGNGNEISHLPEFHG
jgi:hypothetical protein